jgi:type IV secretory pathway VirJ component
MLPALGFMLVLALASRALAQQPLQPSQPASAIDVRGLPLKEIPAAGPSAHVFVVFITGDGGWASIDRDITAEFADHGMNVVGLNSREYLHVRRSPDQVALDVERIVQHYQAEWHTQRFVFVGYSRGADLSPFVVSRMDSTLRRNLALVAMVGLGTRAGFEFHFQDIFREVKRPGDQPIVPELDKIRGVRMMCIYGAEETDSGCRSAPDSLVHRIERPGSHHFDGDYRRIADMILAELG